MGCRVVEKNIENKLKDCLLLEGWKMKEDKVGEGSIN